MKIRFKNWKTMKHASTTFTKDPNFFRNWYYFAAKFIFGFPAISSFLPLPFSNDRLHPGLSFVLPINGTTLKIDTTYEDTRHRYPWICSLRGRGPDKQHHCAVTLLRRPPGPTVLVTAAHCTYLCKSDNIVVPNCCCDNVAQTKCSEDTNKCGKRPMVVEMTGKDVEVICGEWETGNIPKEESGENYNVILPIELIKRHPKFQIDQDVLRTNFVQDDIAAITVKVNMKTEEKFLKNQIYPSCLPTSRPKNTSHGLHSGWSNPPPFYFVQSKIPLFTPYFRDFSKQWHYQMNFADCEDPKVSRYNYTYKFPSNTYYPAGVICAKETNRNFCPTSGESGSPLMSQDNDAFTRFTTDGLLSFSKGCASFSFGKFHSYIDQQSIIDSYGLPAEETQGEIVYGRSFNPLVYTKVYCYLPWIAEQYDLEYSGTSSDDPACSFGSGDPEVANSTICRNIPSSRNGIERECIFPYYVDDRLINDTCFNLNEKDFWDPVPRCPIWQIITKSVDGIPIYNSSDSRLILGGYCPGDNDELDPDKNDCLLSERRTTFSQCKNNCKGVIFLIVSSGAALIFAGSIAGTSLIPQVAAGGFGLLGIGLASQMMCLGPLNCRARNGQCCSVIVRTQGFFCPSSC